MKVSMGMFSLRCEGTNGIVPTARELAEADRRIIYLGEVQTSDGKTLQDAFVFTLNPQKVLTIKDVEARDGFIFLDFEEHSLSSDNPDIIKMYASHRDETYIGTVVVDTATEGRVFEDVYETFLGSSRFYQKEEDGSIRHIALHRPWLSYPDRYRWKITEEENGKQFHYAFLWGINGYNKWLSLSKVNKVLHNFSPSIEAIDDCEVREGMKTYPEVIQKLFESSYSTEGYLALN